MQLLVARTLLVAPGLTTNKKLLVARALVGAPSVTLGARKLRSQNASRLEPPRDVQRPVQSRFGGALVELVERQARMGRAGRAVTIYCPEEYTKARRRNFLI